MATIITLNSTDSGSTARASLNTNFANLNAVLPAGTLIIVTGKTLTVSNSLTLAGTDGSSVAFGTGGTVLYSGGALGTPSSGTLTNATGLPEGGLSTTDITTNNVSTSKHGFAPKLPNDATKFLDGTGAYSTPSVSVKSTAGVSAGPATSSTQTITHSLGTTPKIIRVSALVTVNQSAGGIPNSNGKSFGVWNSSGNAYVAIRTGPNSSGADISSATSTSASIFIEDTSGNIATGVVGNVGATSFDIVWTLSGGGGSVATVSNFLWEAQ